MALKGISGTPFSGPVAGFWLRFKSDWNVSIGQNCSVTFNYFKTYDAGTKIALSLVDPNQRIRDWERTQTFGASHRDGPFVILHPYGSFVRLAGSGPRRKLLQQLRNLLEQL